jgi:DNA replication protein DnaC
MVSKKLLTNQKHQEALLTMGILLKWHSKTWEDFTNDPKAKSKVISYLSRLEEFKDRGVGIYLYGTNSVGKTMLMNLAFKAILDTNKVKIISFSTLVDLYAGGWNDPESKVAFWKAIKEPEFLGIEEPGKEYPSNKGLSATVLDTLLRYRTQMNLPTWFTSNIDPSKFKEVYTAGISEMLKESTIPLLVTGENMRDKVKADLSKLL